MSGYFLNASRNSFQNLFFGFGVNLYLLIVAYWITSFSETYLKILMTFFSSVDGSCSKKSIASSSNVSVTICASYVLALLTILKGNGMISLTNCAAHSFSMRTILSFLSFFSLNARLMRFLNNRRKQFLHTFCCSNVYSTLLLHEHSVISVIFVTKLGQFSSMTLERYKY